MVSSIVNYSWPQPVQASFLRTVLDDTKGAISRITSFLLENDLRSFTSVTKLRA